MKCLHKTLQKIADWVFPGNLVCYSCAAEAVVNAYGLCEECDKDLMLHELNTPIKGIDGYNAGLVFNSVSRKAVHRFKYSGATYIKDFLSHFMKISHDWRIDYVVPVPLNKNRLRERGYNQSTLLAACICECNNLVMREDALVRIIDTPKQIDMNAKQRMQNLRNAFRAANNLKGMSILLVDDVKTTGATLMECAKELKKNGVRKVYAITACCVSEVMF